MPTQTGPIQTTYARNMAPGFVGAIANQELFNIFSRRAVAEIAFGVVVLQGTEDDTCKVPDGNGESYLGVTVRDQSTGAITPNSFGANEDVRIADKGVIWVTLAGTVAANQGAAFLDANGGFVASGTANSTGILQGKYAQAGVSGDLVQLRLG